MKSLKSKKLKEKLKLFKPLGQSPRLQSLKWETDVIGVLT